MIKLKVFDSFYKKNMKGKLKMKNKIKEIDVNSLDELNDFYETIEEVKDFDLYVLFLMMKNELLKRGYKLL